jgi:uncharacterized protein
MIDTIFTSVANTINRHPKAVICILGLVFLVALFGMTQLTMETGASTYMDQESSKGILYNKYIDTFQSDSLILIIDTSDPLNPDVLAYLDQLQGDIRQQQNIKSVNGIVDILKAANHGKLPSTRAEVDTIVATIPPETRATVVPSNVMSLVQIKLNQGLSDKTKTATLNNIKAVVVSSSPPPGVKVTVTGSPAFSAEMSSSLGKDMATLIGGAMILMVIAMGILFAYVRYRFMPVVLVGVGLITSLGLMGVAGIKLNMAVIGAFPVLIGLGIDYAIQFHARFDEEARKGTLGQAVFMTVTRTGPAVLYAMVATCMGFMAMFISPVPMIRSFGLVAIIGVSTCYFVSLLGMPTIAILLNYKPKVQNPPACYAVGEGACNSLDDESVQQNVTGTGKKPWSYGDFLTSTSVRIAKNPIPVLLIVGLIAVIGFQLDPLIPIDSNENSFVPSDMPAKISMDKVGRVIGSTDSATIYVEGQSVTDLDTIRWMKQYQDYELSHHAELTRATSIVTYILAYNNGAMPETQGQLYDVLARIPSSVKDSYISDSMNAVIEFGTIKLESKPQESLKEQMIKDIAFLEPPVGITVQPSGRFEMFTSLMQGLTSSKDAMTYLGFILIFFYLLIVYRHLHAISPLVPIIAIVGWNAVAMYVLGIAYSPLTATLGSMTIGVAAEYTILVMERYAEEEERLHDSLAAIQESVKKIGTAITVSGLATFFGFSALCLASFPIMSNFGVTTLIAVGFSLMGAIFVMPAILSVVGQFTEWMQKRKHQSG